MNTQTIPMIDQLALMEENHKLRQQADIDNQLIIDLGKKLKEANDRIKELEAKQSEVNSTLKRRNRRSRDS